MKKSDRQLVFDKYGGRCAYSGKPLDDKWQVDHVNAICYFQWGINKGDPNHIDNLLPALRILNHYKRERNLEDWRAYLSTLHLRIKKLPKKTRVPRTERRITYLLEVASHFDITADKPFNGVFYFETLTTTEK